MTGFAPTQAQTQLPGSLPMIASMYHHPGPLSGFKRPLEHTAPRVQLPTLSSVSRPQWRSEYTGSQSLQDIKLLSGSVFSTGMPKLKNGLSNHGGINSVSTLPSLKQIMNRYQMQQAPPQQVLVPNEATSAYYHTMQQPHHEQQQQHPHTATIVSRSPSNRSPSPSHNPSITQENSKRRERWTEEEHARFMEGLNRYGRKWKKIQACVKTKTAIQVRTHAYGYFAKLLRNMPEDDAIWELAEEMSSLPGAVVKGPGNGKKRTEPKTDEEGMEVLRKFVFAKKRTRDNFDEKTKKQNPHVEYSDEAFSDSDTTSESSDKCSSNRGVVFSYR
jgi:SHAQKYF class myb-like DNA-binding protein